MGDAAATVAAMKQLDLEPRPFPWWLVVLGIFAVLALSEPQRG